MKLLLLFFAGVFALPVPCTAQAKSDSRLESLLATAQDAQARQDFSAAADAYRAVVRIRPEIAEMRANLGIMEYEAGQYKEAVADLGDAIRAKPSLFTPYLFLGLDYLRLEKPKDAVPYLVKAEKMNPSDPQAPLAMGRAEASLNDYAAATRAYRRAITLEPENSSAWFALGMAYLAQVEGQSRTLAGLDPRSSYSKALFAESLTEQRRYLEAIDLYKGILDSPSGPPCIRSALGFVYLRQALIPEAAQAFNSERAANPGCNLAYIGSAAINFASSNNDEALQDLQQSWDRDRGFTEERLPVLIDTFSRSQIDGLRAFVTARSSQVSGNAGQDSLIEALVQQFEKGEPATPSPAGQQPVQLHSAAGTLQKAQETYKQGHYGQCARLLNPVSAESTDAVLRTSAACSYLAGDAASASTAAAISLAKTPSGAEMLYWSIKANEKLALQALDRFQHIAPDSAKTHLLLGDMDRQRQHYDEAILEYKQALTMVPNDPAALQGLASAYLLNDKYDDTVTTAASALAQRPRDPELNLLMGEALVAQRKYEQAEAFLNKSLSVKPQQLPHVHALLGKVYAATGRTSEAIANLKLGLEADEDGSIHYQLARLYRQVGDLSEASEAMEQSKALLAARRVRATVALQDTPPPDEP